ncbi:hypothetical protein [Kribbella endophytica]
MPQDSPAEWTNALRENGRLTTGPERNRLLITLALPAGLLLLNGYRIIGQLSDGVPWGFFEYFRVAFTILAAAVVLGVLNNLRTRRWVVVVDAAGVALGSRKLAWSEISSVNFADDQVVLRPVTGAQELTIGKETLRDLPAFAQWLTAQLTTRTG